MASTAGGSGPGIRLALWAAALASAGCVAGSATGPSGTAAPPPPPTSVLTWAGSARFSSNSPSLGDGSYTASFEGPVTWQKDDGPDPEPPARPGAVRYKVSAGQMQYRATRTWVYPDLTYTCTLEGASAIALVGNDDPDLRSYLYLWEDGQYTGLVYQNAALTITRTCQDGRVSSFPGDVTVALWIKGSVTDGRRMQGEMAPETVGGTTETGSWDFSAR